MKSLAKRSSFLILAVFPLLACHAAEETKKDVFFAHARHSDGSWAHSQAYVSRRKDQIMTYDGLLSGFDAFFSRIASMPMIPVNPASVTDPIAFFFDRTECHYSIALPSEEEGRAHDGCWLGLEPQRNYVSFESAPPLGATADEYNAVWGRYVECYAVAEADMAWLTSFVDEAIAAAG